MTLKPLAVCAALCALVLGSSVLVAAAHDVDAEPGVGPEGGMMARFDEAEDDADEPLPARRALLDYHSYNSYRSRSSSSKYQRYAKWAIKELYKYPSVVQQLFGSYYNPQYKLYYKQLKKVWEYKKYNGDTYYWDYWYKLKIRVKYGYGNYWQYYDIYVWVYVPYPYEYPEYFFRLGWNNRYYDGQWS